MAMRERILAAYRAFKSGHNGEFTPAEHEAAQLAANYSEAQLRLAIVMKAAFVRNAAPIKAAS